MAGSGLAENRPRSLDRLRRADPRSEDRRAGVRSRAPGRLFLRRRARIEEDACAQGRAVARARARRRNDRAYSCADRTSNRGGEPGGNCGCDSRRDYASPPPRPGGQAVKFGPVAVAEAQGAITAHSVRAGAKVVRKGTVISAADVAALSAAGIAEVVVARLEPGDVAEDEAAAALARAVGGDGIAVEPAFTGRSNLHAESAGVLLVDREGIERLNRVDEAVTFATLPAYRSVREGEMVGTIKIIPFAVAGEVQRAALAAAKPLLSIAPFKLKRVALVSTRLPGLAEKVIEKTVRVTAARLAPMRAAILSDERVPHEAKSLSQSIKSALAEDADLVIVFGASAIADRRDVIPAAIEEAGGRIEHFGMPVDPGNLMLIGAVGAVPVIGAPGCARSRARPRSTRRMRCASPQSCSPGVASRVWGRKTSCSPISSRSRSCGTR